MTQSPRTHPQIRGLLETGIYLPRFTDRGVACDRGLAQESQLVTCMNALSMLFGAALVALGVLAAALADRIRGLRVAREAASRPPRMVIPVVEQPEPVRQAAPKPRAPRQEAKQSAAEGGDDVIAALVAAGYKKPIATEATWACSSAERATVEGWTASALRRCARGGMS